MKECTLAHASNPFRIGAFQHGAALFIVIVFVMLSVLLALWASRSVLFGEMIVGNDADYQRAFEAAQAMLQDAELDIRGENPDGTKCSPNSSDEAVCRRSSALDMVPLESKDVGLLLATLADQRIQCRNGLCTKRSGKQDFWNNGDPTKGTTLAQMTETQDSPVSTIGARYGMFTGATLKGAGGESADSILADRSAADRGGWYWIEVLPYDESSKNSGLIMAETTNPHPTAPAAAANNYLALNLVPNVVYRITVLAYGRRKNSVVVLQQTYARQKIRD